LLGLIVAAGIVVAAAFALAPGAAATSPPPDWKYGWPVVRGAIHIHSTRSDGTGTVDEIAAAAARAGLQFVVITDHGDGTGVPVPPAYRSGVLCLEGVEVSTTYGHYVALGMPQMPYRLAGHPRDVIEDVRRAGGFGIAAHPGSPKAQLRWDDWDAPFDGLEWLNADSEWRDELWGSLGRVLLTYAIRPTETLTRLLDRPADVIAQWDRLARLRHIVGLAGADAHGRLGLKSEGEPYQGRVLAPLPSYEASFRTFSNNVILDGPLTGDAAVDAANLLTALRVGRTFTVIDGAATLGAFEVKALSAGSFARPGEYIDTPYPVEIDAMLAAPAGTKIVLFKDGVPIYDVEDKKLRIDVGREAAAYRVEAHLPGGHNNAAVPWLVSNPIYVNLRAAHETPRPPAIAAVLERAAVATQSWHAESSAGSDSALVMGALPDATPALQWRLRLAQGPPVAQFAAIWFPADQGLATHDRLQLRARADRPMRLWAQLRAPGARGEERWVKSFYVGTDLTTIDLKLADFTPVGATSSSAPPLDKVDSLLLVVDTLNTLPGTATTISIADLWLVK
jgi:hypothetical protein